MIKKQKAATATVETLEPKIRTLSVEPWQPNGKEELLIVSEEIVVPTKEVRVAEPVSEKKASTHYVDNKRLFAALVEWQKDLKRAHRKKLPKPQLPEYVAECMMKMANRLSQKAGFVNYTYREDMVGDALESCLRYIHNFNPAKSNNAFAYITQIIHNAFIRRIQKEQKQLYVKMRIVDDADFVGSYERQEGDTNTYNNSYVTYLQENKGDVISKFESWKESKKSKANAKKKEAKLLAGLFVEEEEETPKTKTKTKVVKKIRASKPKAKAAGKKK